MRAKSHAPQGSTASAHERYRRERSSWPRCSGAWVHRSSSPPPVCGRASPSLSWPTPQRLDPLSRRPTRAVGSSRSARGRSRRGAKPTSTPSRSLRRAPLRPHRRGCRGRLPRRRASTRGCEPRPPTRPPRAHCALPRPRREGGRAARRSGGSGGSCSREHGSGQAGEEDRRARRPGGALARRAAAAHPHLSTSCARRRWRDGRARWSSGSLRNQRLEKVSVPFGGEALAGVRDGKPFRCVDLAGRAKDACEPFHLPVADEFRTPPAVKVGGARQLLAFDEAPGGEGHAAPARRAERFADALSCNDSVLVLADDVLEALGAGHEASRRRADGRLGELGSVARTLGTHADAVKVRIGWFTRQLRHGLSKPLELARCKRPKRLLATCRCRLPGKLAETVEKYKITLALERLEEMRARQLAVGGKQLQEPLGCEAVIVR